jgi:hypothetical protein
VPTFLVNEEKGTYKNNKMEIKKGNHKKSIIIPK